MIADTSAIVSILANESDAAHSMAAMEWYGEALVSIAAAVELMPNDCVPTDIAPSA